MTSSFAPLDERTPSLFACKDSQMPMLHDVARANAAHLLRELLPLAAVRKAEMDGGHATASNPLSQGLMRHLRPDNVTGVHIHVNEHGGWYADLLLTNVPAGLPDVIGTPSSSPLTTRDAAIDAGITLLALVLALAEEPTEKPEGDDLRYFDFDSFCIGVPSQVVEAAAADPRLTAVSADTVKAQLNGLLSAAFPEGISEGAYRALPEDAASALNSAIVVALSRGMFRFPPPSEGIPSATRRLHLSAYFNRKINMRDSADLLIAAQMIEVDEVPFIIADGRITLNYPGVGHPLPVEAVGTYKVGDVTVCRFYFKGENYHLQFAVEEDGAINDCRLFQKIHEFFPQNDTECEFWISDVDGYIGYPSFQSPDGLRYTRLINGDTPVRVAPLPLIETIRSSARAPGGLDMRTSNFHSMLYRRETGLAEPAPQFEYL